MKITVLGCGSSGGVPMVGLGWGECDPNEPRNRRTRASILVEDDETRLLVDVSPDLRGQLLAADVSALDAVLLTHAHADHCHGIDDIRWINIAMSAAVPAYGDAATLAEVGRRFPYAFEPLREFSNGRYYKPTIEPREIDGPFAVGSIGVLPFEQDHGFSTTLGFRFGAFAYSTDLVALDDAAFEALDGVELWVVDAFGRKPGHPTHAHLGLALSWIERVKPHRAVLTHMGSGLDYATLREELPDGVEPGYDGMVLEI